MPALDATLSQKIALIAAKGQKRSLTNSERHDGVFLTRAGKRLVSMSCNDSYGLTQHPMVIEAAAQALEQYGAGAGASRLVSGNHPLYDKLETMLARKKQAQAALVFGSGYLANLGAIPALVGKNDLIIADKFIHACMIDAAQLSGATFLRFAHNNVAHCRMLLEANRADHQNCLVLTETVFSMDGDRAPISGFNELAQEFDAWVMSDDAHGMYVTQQPDHALIQMGTLSKALGSYGGYIAGSRMLVEYLQTAARSLIYSTGLPPSNIAAAIAAMEILENDSGLREAPLKNAKYFTQLLGIKEAQSAIVPVITGEGEKAVKAAALMDEHGYYVAAIRPPTVPENSARLRFAFSALHTKPQIEKAAELLLTNGFICVP